MESTRGLWEISRHVVPRAAAARTASQNHSSASGSSDAEASSSTSTDDSSRRARASAILWRSPLESHVPSAPNLVSYPEGRRFTNSSTPARFAARAMSACDAVALPKAMFSRTLQRASRMSCGTNVTTCGRRLRESDERSESTCPCFSRIDLVGSVPPRARATNPASHADRAISNPAKAPRERSGSL